jgi:pilus assembly protein CpaC
MKKVRFINRALGTALAAALVIGGGVTATAPAHAQTRTVKPYGDVMIAVGSGHLLKLPGAMTDLFVADPNVADVQVRSANQLYIFGKSAGETSIYATNAAGKVIYSTNVKVGQNIDSVGELIHLAMPNSQVRATPLNGVLLLTGTVASPQDVEEATRIVQAYVGDGTKIISRLRTATPQQVMLRVRFAEVSRSLSKDIGFNIMTRDNSGGFLFGLFRGAPGTITDLPTGGFPRLDASPLYGLPPGSISLPFDPATSRFITKPEDAGQLFTWLTNPERTTIGAAGKLLGLDVLSALELAQQDGRATILAEPTLTALSGETASFLAGGEFPIPISQSLGSVSVEYKQYGIGLAFTPTVLDDGRISMRVRPEVSELSDLGSIRLNNFQIPGVSTRRAETTVELGSGQSFMIGGLLRNTGNNSVDKAPWLGDLPILGALFRSNSFRRQETELVIIVTPYLVKPINDSEIALPTDGYRHANDAQRVFMNRDHDSISGAQRPGPTMAPAPPATPTLGAASGPVAPAIATASKAAAPGFSF